MVGGIIWTRVYPRNIRGSRLRMGDDINRFAGVRNKMSGIAPFAGGTLNDHDHAARFACETN
jgi:hypothetical protein